MCAKLYIWAYNRTYRILVWIGRKLEKHEFTAVHSAVGSSWELLPYNFKVDWFAGVEDQPSETTGSSAWGPTQPASGSSPGRDEVVIKRGLILAWSRDHLPSGNTDWATLFPKGRG